MYPAFVETNCKRSVMLHDRFLNGPDFGSGGGNTSEKLDLQE